MITEYFCMRYKTPNVRMLNGPLVLRISFAYNTKRTVIYRLFITSGLRINDTYFQWINKARRKNRFFSVHNTRTEVFNLNDEKQLVLLSGGVSDENKRAASILLSTTLSNKKV